MRRLAKLGKHVLLAAGALMTAYPIIWMVLSSFKTDEEIFTGKLLALPSVWMWENYVHAMQIAPFGRFFLNSVIMSVSTVLGQLILCTLAAYAFALVNFAGKRTLFVAMIATTMVPFEATMIPSYLIVKELGMLDTYMGLIVPKLTSVFGIFLLRQYFLTIPRDLIEAGKIDGCSHLRTLVQIIVPLSKAPFATLSIFTFLNMWNSYLWPLLVTSRTELRPVQVGLRYMVDEQLGTQWPELLAASTIVIMPVLLLFLAAQKYFVKNMVYTGIK